MHLTFVAIYCEMQWSSHKEEINFIHNLHLIYFAYLRNNVVIKDIYVDTFVSLLCIFIF